VQWTLRAVKQAKKIQRARIVKEAGKLSNWPACRESMDIKRLKNRVHEHRLRVGRYRVLFDVETGLRVVSVEQVRK